MLHVIYLKNLLNLSLPLVAYVFSQATKSKNTTYKFKAKIAFNKNFAILPFWLKETNIIHLFQAALNLRFRILVLFSSSQELRQFSLMGICIISLDPWQSAKKCCIYAT